MSFLPTHLHIDRGSTNNSAGISAMGTHTYINLDDTAAVITAPDYFPAYFGVRQEDVQVNDLITIRASDGIATYTIAAVNPVSLTEETPAGGNVDGAASSTDNALVRWNGTTGKLIKNSTATLSNEGNIIVPGVSHKFGNSTENADTTFHIQSMNEAYLWMEADTSNILSEGNNPVITQSQDLNNTAVTIGLDEDNRWIVNRSGSGSPSNDIVFKVNATVSGGGSIGVKPTLSGGTEALVIKAGGPTGGVVIPVSATFATTGGTASAFDYYEETADIALTTTGAISGTWKAYYVRIGRIVNMYFPGFQDDVGMIPGPLITFTGIPARFRPYSYSLSSLGNQWPVVVSDAGTLTDCLMTMDHATGASLALTKVAGTDFTGIIIVPSLSFTWILPPLP